MPGDINASAEIHRMGGVQVPSLIVPIFRTNADTHGLCCSGFGA